MQHLGDITQIHGDAVPIVDCIIGGSPCQDLSVARKRAGLAGERSGLFMEQTRITKEMREHDRNAGRTDQLIRPRYMVWENVPGAFSSNKGEDFASVLTEIVRIAEPDAPRVPVPCTGWPKWGSLRDVGGRWSVAWRTLDAQYWGVPQRRRRIALVADFGGDTAAEILFVGESVCGDSPSRGAEGQGAAGNAARSTGGAICYGISSYDSNAMRSSNPYSGIYEADTSRTLDVGGGNPACNQGGIAILDMSHASDVIRECGDVAPTLQSRMGTGGNQVPLAYQMQGFGDYHAGEVASSCKQRDFKDSTDLVCSVDWRTGMAVRRLTPLECERIQGYPDGWTDIGAWTDSKGKLHKESSDSARYKALGNSIALPPWKWVLKRLCAQYERDATMASLFDGIGGFPLIWEQINGAGSCLWASEIEEFPIAVTKRRFERMEL